MKLRWIGAALGLLCLASCMNMTIDESTAFAPPKRDATGPAPSVAALDQRWAARVVGPDFGGVTPVKIEHGLLGAGDQRIAVTQFSAGGPQPRPLIVHCAGNGGDRYNSAVMYARKALPFGDVLVFDYPGYGDSTGAPRAEDFEAALPMVVAEAKARAGERPLIFWGQSLGGFICARMAALTPSARALILETTARNAAQVAQAWTPWYASAVVRVNVAESLASYDTSASAQKFGGPVLVVGAARDDVLPVKLARALADDLTARGAPVRYIEFAKAGHMTVPDQPDFSAELNDFFKSLPKD